MCFRRLLFRSARIIRFEKPDIGEQQQAGIQVFAVVGIDEVAELFVPCACLDPLMQLHRLLVPVTGAIAQAQFGGDMRQRSEERRVGKESVSTCRSRWSRYN